jgi:hypothetical protein
MTNLAVISTRFFARNSPSIVSTGNAGANTTVGAIMATLNVQKR